MRKELTFNEAMQIILLHAAEDGRGKILFGDSLERVERILPPFLSGDVFPHVYLEFPLLGQPSLDVSVLYRRESGRLRVNAPAAAGTGGMLDWFAGASGNCPDICCGYELDTGLRSDPGMAAVHFQPRDHQKLVEPFCASLGEEAQGALYLSAAKRMPAGWPLSFFGIFRGRADSALRICGYLDREEQERCAGEPGRIRSVFRELDFPGYSDEMPEQVSLLLKAAQGHAVDFQFDLQRDGKLTGKFALDVGLNLSTPKKLHAAFTDGEHAKIRQLLEDWNITDSRWQTALDMCFAWKLPVEKADGSSGICRLLLLPAWIKVRWINGILQPAKMYCYAWTEMA